MTTKLRKLRKWLQHPNDFNDSFWLHFRIEIRAEILQDICPTAKSIDFPGVLSYFLLVADSSAQPKPKCAKEVPTFGSLQPHRIRLRSTNTLLFSLRACWIKNPMFHYLKLRLRGLAVYRGLNNESDDDGSIRSFSA